MKSVEQEHEVIISDQLRGNMARVMDDMDMDMRESVHQAIAEDTRIEQT